MTDDQRDDDGRRAPDPSGEAGPTSSSLPEEDHLREHLPGDLDLARALPLVRHLRRHCPWDARQTPRSLRPYLLEEAEEVADAVEEGDDGELSGELGDLLLNLAFQVVLAEERGSFEATDVVRRLEEKMKERHPHVYGEAEEAPPWEVIKAREGSRAEEDAAGEGREISPEDAGRPPAEGEGGGGGCGGSADRAEGPGRGAPRGPLAAALRAQERAADRNFDWPDARGALAKVREEADEVQALAAGGAGTERVREEVGDLLFAAVNAARLSSVDPARALLGAVSKFRDRWGRVLELAASRGLDPREATLEELDALWDQVKEEGGGERGEGSPPG